MAQSGRLVSRHGGPYGYMIRAGDGLGLRSRELQPWAGEEPILVASELMSGSSCVLDNAGPAPQMRKFTWFHVPISGTNPGDSANDRQVLLDFIDHFAVLSFSVLVHTVGSIDRHEVHGSVKSTE